MTTYYAQTGEDRIADALFSGEAGVFVDVGAHDGITLSNTYYLAQKGWTGVCIEPHDSTFKQLVQNRPESHCYRYACVSDLAAYPTGTATYWHEPTTAFSGLEPKAQEAQRVYKQQGRTWKGLTPHDVPVSTLTLILLAAGIRRIDLLSIDTEGTELNVLRGIDLKQFKPRLVIVELNDEIGVDKRLIASGYMCARRTGVNGLFVRTMDDARVVQSA